ncbi:V-type ATP synthase subunit D [Acholeplasma equirhinis]|uniref:V-type ATP synthase subunit D n=1 Tax=Acholeplasma equirhinis TaxID=555393 RepID=UPI00197AC0FE|nr:V-type ATP synthase subunit D [Acholeplasma equirhinis]MBN3491193.1 V-type ATP synthase subunit D [Acholeplasma equirhinis]
MLGDLAPTKGALLSLKKSYTLARTGENLMERKKNTLIQEMLTLLSEVSVIRKQIEETYQRAYLALQDANITLGIVGEIAKAIPVDKNIKLSYRSVMGVDLPIINYEKARIRLSYGLKSTNSKFDYAYRMFGEARDLTIKLAEIDASAYRLADAIRKSRTRYNALKNIVIPEIETKIKSITEVLEEHEREEFIRLKLIKKNI